MYEGTSVYTCHSCLWLLCGEHTQSLYTLLSESNFKNYKIPLNSKRNLLFNG